MSRSDHRNALPQLEYSHSVEAVKPATEEFLYFLLWTADSLVRPSWRDVTGTNSFESWAYRNGLSRRLGELERMKLIESRAPRTAGERVVRLTSDGVKAALAGVDPDERWRRPWDGRWRLVLFDVPEHESSRRVQLRRRLRAWHFGNLQNSVWVSPEPLDEIRRQFAGARIDVASLVLFEGRPAGGESDEALVTAAWDFEALERLYENWARIADLAPELKRDRPTRVVEVRAWAARERAAWRAIAERDPFLPEALLPDRYPGRAAWRRRGQLLHFLGQGLAGE